MDRLAVGSSNLLEVGYDSASQTLEVLFTNGTIYQYYNVGEELFNEMMRAPSKGQFLNIYLRNSYPYSRVG